MLRRATSVPRALCPSWQLSSRRPRKLQQPTICCSMRACVALHPPPRMQVCQLCAACVRMYAAHLCTHVLSRLRCEAAQA